MKPYWYLKLKTVRSAPSTKNGSVRSVDVARALSFSKPSVSRAIGILKDDGYVKVEDNGELSLTEAGLERAGAIYERHRYIGVPHETAEADACRIEHIVSQETFEKVKEYLARGKD